MSEPQSLAARIDALEIRIAYQDETIETLNKTITEQWRQIDALSREVVNLRDRLHDAEMKSGAGAAPEPPPPALLRRMANPRVRSNICTPLRRIPLQMLDQRPRQINPEHLHRSSGAQCQISSPTEYFCGGILGKKIAIPAQDCMVPLRRMGGHECVKLQFSQRLQPHWRRHQHRPTI